MYSKTKRRLPKLRAWREAGMSYREIGRRLGISTSGAHNLCHRHGVDVVRPLTFSRMSPFPGIVAMAKEAMRRKQQATRAFWMQHGVAEAVGRRPIRKPSRTRAA